MRLNAIRSSPLFAFVLAVLAAIPFALLAQTTAKGPVAVRFTATTANVSGAGEAIKIDLSNWSTDTDRDQMVAAWTLTAAPATGGRGGRGRGRGGRGARGAAPAAVVDDPAAVDDDNPAFRFGRGARGRGDDAPAAAETPQSSLLAALKKAPTVGILWTSETVGYSIKYACRLQQADGGEHIILATNRRVGAWNNLWKPLGAGNTTDYEFSIFELHMNSRGEGEGKGSVTGRIAVDTEAKTIALDGYNTLPVILKGVKRLP
jgi:hypothetical protein